MLNRYNNCVDSDGKHSTSILHVLHSHLEGKADDQNISLLDREPRQS